MNKQDKRRIELFRGFAVFLELASGEYILTRLEKSNGGTVVFLRALQVSVLVYLAGLGAMNWIDPGRTETWSFLELRRQLIDNAESFGVLFGGSYAALYARFSSQWSYLASVYNQMKAAQVRTGSDLAVLAEWRAGFIEDCDELHLVRKPMFASIVYGLLSDDMPGVQEIRAVFDRHAPGGEHRRNRIFTEVKAAVESVQTRYLDEVVTTADEANKLGTQLNDTSG